MLLLPTRQPSRSVNALLHVPVLLWFLLPKHPEEAFRFFTPVHVVVAFPDQLVDDLKDAFNFIKSKYKDQQPSATTFITGPSRTADIGNELVTGAQGPAEVYLFLVDKR
ncbi:MAG: LUD domain-containing protein [Bacteroidetes bacterium]|nr:LUD domain-containing protein [Bacteroidota bacterium]